MFPCCVNGPAQRRNARAAPAGEKSRHERSIDGNKCSHGIVWLLSPPPPHITGTPVVPPQGRYQAASRDLGLSQPPQDVDQLTHPLDTAGGAVSGNPGSPSRSNAKSAQNWPQIWNFGTLEVSLRRSAADDDHISGVGGCDIDCMS